MAARVAFLGSPEFAVQSLRALARASEVVLVVTQPARPTGRGRKVEPTPVHRAALDLGLEVLTHERGQRAALESRLAELHLDALIVVAFGHILRPSTLALATHGAVNVHASLLPRWRGVAPVERALQAGDAVTGITLMQLDAGVDTGPILAQRAVPIEDEDTRVSLLRRLSEVGAQLLTERLADFVQGRLEGRPQPETGACYAPRLEKSEGRIDWNWDAVRIWRHVRALYEWPGAYTQLGDTTLKVHAVRPLDVTGAASPGTIVEADAHRGARVACGAGSLELLELQLPGKARMSAAEFVRGRHLRAGQRLGG